MNKKLAVTRNIAKKGVISMRSSSPASISVYLDSDVLRNPFQAILPPLETILIKQTLMKKLEKTLAIITSVALILKLLSVPGMSLFFVIGLLGLAMLYFYLGFALFNGIEFKGIFNKASYLGVSKYKLFSAIGVGVTLSIICIGVLFKIQHWFGSSQYLYSGLVLAFVLLVIALINFNRTKDAFNRLLLTRLILFSLLGALVLIVHI